MRRRFGPVLLRGRPSLPGSARSARRRLPVLALLLMLGAAAMFLSSCRVEMTVRVESDEFGKGRIAVTADLDRDAAAAVFPQQSLTAPESAASTEATTGRVRIDDFRRAGWEGPGIVRNADGSARFSLLHRFTSVAEANALLGQLSGPNGPLADLRISRSRSPWSTTVSLTGPGDFRGGVSSFGDERLASVTGSGAFGVSEAEVLRQAGAESLGAVFGLRVDGRLLSAERSWALPPGAATPVSLSGSRTSWATIAGAVAAAFALLAFVLLQLRADRSGDDDPRDDGAAEAGAAEAGPAEADGAEAGPTASTIPITVDGVRRS